eukprot:scaffold258424_cov37-Tisochrysis_lutea.AAC.7
MSNRRKGGSGSMLGRLATATASALNARISGRVLARRDLPLLRGGWRSGFSSSSTVVAAEACEASGSAASPRGDAGGERTRR